MFQAYTYYLYHVPTGKKYYGSRAANKCEPEQDLWNAYFSSSKLVDDLIKEHGKGSFIAEVRKKFDTEQEARDWEDKVLRKLKAPSKEEWLNQAYMCGPNYYGNWNGRKHREDSKAKIGDKNRGKIRTEETKQKIRDNHPHLSGKDHHNFGKKMSDEDKAYLSILNSGEGNPFFGKTHDEETRKIMREINAGEGNPMYGKTHTPENREKIRQSKLGENNPMYGISLSGDRNGMYGKKHSPERNKTHSEFMKEYWRKKKLGLSQSDTSNTNK